MDVGHYLTRIQADAPISIDLKTLAILQLAHLKAVPFENLDIHYGKHITLDVERFYEKIVINKRGVSATRSMACFTRFYVSLVSMLRSFLPVLRVKMAVSLKNIII